MSQRSRPWLGSVLLHAAFVALLVVAATNWRSERPPEQLAIEGNVVRYEDLPPSVRAGKALREPAPAPRVDAPPPAPEVDPAAQQRAEALARERERLAAEREAERQRADAQQRQAAETQREQAVQAQKARAAEALAAKQRATEEAEARRKAELQRQQEALAAKQRQAEQDKAAQASRQRSEREAELRRALASEEESEAVARSGVVDEYRALLTQTIERNWIRPPSAGAGLECVLHVTQATGGTVIDVRVGTCNGDQAVRESIANAVYRSSPLPAPRDPRAFQRQLEIVFKPRE